MPLIVPGVTANNLGDSKTQEWLNKLMGKTLTDGNHSETVGLPATLSPLLDVLFNSGCPPY